MTKKKLRNQELINYLKSLTYKGREKIFAPLILEVLDAANNLNPKLRNCILEHNIMENILTDEFQSFIGDEFGRNEKEMGIRFISACKNLQTSFNKAYGVKRLQYYSAEFRNTRNFMRRLMLKLIPPLELKRYNQPVFVSVSMSISDDRTLWFAFSTGTRGGNNVLNLKSNVPHKISLKSMKKIGSETEKLLKSNNYDMEAIYNDLDEMVQRNIFPTCRVNGNQNY